jgi:signal peptidase I
VSGFLTELPVLVLVAFALALLMKTFLIQAFFIPSSSMEPTLLINDRVLVNKVTYELREPRRGEVVVFREADAIGDDRGVGERLWDGLTSGLGVVPPTEKDFIKRIIGLPGDTVEMRDGVVYVNEEALVEAPSSEGGYLSSRDFSSYGPATVPEGQYFMMGDNRPASADSRSSLGTIPRDDIVGRAFVIIFPFTRAGTLPGAVYGNGLDGDGSQASLAPLAPAA